MFLLDQRFSGCELARFDPADDRITTLMPPPVRDNPSVARGLAALDNERVVFIGDLPGLVAPHLWVSDATRAGTRLLHELVRATRGSMPAPFLPQPGGLLFAATDAESGTEVWRSDGTLAGTERVSDGIPDWFLPPSMEAVAGGAVLLSNEPRGLWFVPGRVGSAEQIASFDFTGGAAAMVAAGGRAWFRPASSELWVTDGTAAGTRLVSTAARPALEDCSAVLGELLLFGNESDRRLWRSDGTAAGTWSLGNDGPTELGEVTAAAGFAALRGWTPEAGEELWRSDGTPAGTWQVADLRPGADGAYPRNLTRVGDAVYFDADDGVAGRELWRTDGRGLTLVADLRPGRASGIPDNSESSAQATFAHRGLLYFAATTADGPGLWRSDGTAAGTLRLKSGGGERYFVAVDETVFFVDGACEGGRGLWQTDRGATTARCVLQLDAPASFFFDRPGNLAISEGVLYFPAFDPRTGAEPWAVPLVALFCRGDADGDRRVSIDELVRGVAIALGAEGGAALSSFDGDGDGRIGIAELVAGVGAATLGCTSP